ncbi:hypothetical protein [Sediminibacillus albus]|uniref:Flagellar protein FliT n=1 Tax=Sediminibacillus albus TaxID=407036 RepID=A0A1G8YNH6_9BACI|nr:hypothetical protein [Sediminibacillus albus]SDK04286.1 flagellar protein FliT [Sediminibacillus albus]
MNRLQSFYDVTEELHQQISDDIPIDKREEAIARIEQVLEEREELLKDIKPPYSEEEMETGRALLPLNRDIQDKLKQLLILLRTEMKTVKKQRSSSSKYKNPYKNVSNFDGMFLDHKK